MKALTIMLMAWCALIGPPQAEANNAGAVVLVNSQSPRYVDFAHFIQPYLDNFGVPYVVVDISSNAIDAILTNYALIIIGHTQLDTNSTYLSSAGQSNLSLAVFNGTGLVSFDNTLAATNGAPFYQFEQDIFGLTYTNAVDGGTVVFPPTEAGGTMHYITSLHSPHETLLLSNANSLSVIAVPGLQLPASDTAVATCGGAPFVVATRYGQGRAVQWTSYDWVMSMVHGPVNGLDDLVWRGMVWAARKPFVVRALPNFATLRVDDVTGDYASGAGAPPAFWWVHAMTNAGFKPFLSLFIDDITHESNIYPGDGRLNDLSNLVASGSVTASVHSFSATQTTPTNFFYFNHATEAPYSDATMAQNYQRGTAFLASNQIASSSSVVSHYSEVGPNAVAGLTNWGVQFLCIQVSPGTVEYGASNGPWLAARPYRLYETPGIAQANVPFFVADWLTIPGQPELNGKIFDVCTEVRNVGPPYEWGPGYDTVAGAISRGTQMLKRGFDSLTLANLYTHEFYIDPTDGPNYSQALTTNNFPVILSGILSNLAPYHPIFVTLDFANQYVRATRTSQLTNADFDPATGQITAAFSGLTDIPTTAYYYTGVDGGITNVPATVPVFAGGTNILLAGRPQLLAPAVQGGSVTFTVRGLAGVSYSLEGSLDVHAWMPLQTVTLTDGTAVVRLPLDGTWQFVRARALP